MEDSWRTILHPKISQELSKTTKKELKKRNYLAYLGGKNVGRWKRGGEQFYKKESANNTPKTPKKHQKKQKQREKIPKKAKLKHIPWFQKYGRLGGSRSRGLQEKIGKQPKKSTQKHQKSENKAKKHLKK